MKIVWTRSIGWNMSFNGIGKIASRNRTPMEITEKIFNGPDCYAWRKVFAYRPVKTISGKWVWLRKVYKQRFWAVWGAGFHMEPTVEYGDLFDVLATPTQVSSKPKPPSSRFVR